MNLKQSLTQEFIDELIVQNINQNLIRYSLFMKFISGCEKFPIEQALARQIFASSKMLPSGALAAVCADPTFSFWIYLSSGIMKRLEKGEEIPESDLPYAAYLKDRAGYSLLGLHLLEVNRFLFSAAMLARCEFAGQVLFIENRCIFPFLYISVEISEWNGARDCRLMHTDLGWCLAMGDQAFKDFEPIIKAAETGGTSPHVSEFIRVHPSIRSSSGKVVIDSTDSYIRSGWSMIFKNPDGSSYIPVDFQSLTAEVESISAAMKEIDEAWPEMNWNISNVIRTVHVVKSPYEDRHMSCTSDQFFGCILLSTGEPFMLAEALVHEYSHNILNMMIKTGEFFDGPPPLQELYYSPWRNDARHILGVLHAVFVFTNVSQLLERMSQRHPENEYLTNRKLDNLIRLELGLEVLKHFPFTKTTAINLLEEMESNFSSLKKIYAGHNFSESIYSQLQHLKKWMEKYGKSNLPESFERLFNLSDKSI
jgi:hypothetical protein